jgi:hypothetical protein
VYLISGFHYTHGYRNLGNIYSNVRNVDLLATRNVFREYQSAALERNRFFYFNNLVFSDYGVNPRIVNIPDG